MFKQHCALLLFLFSYMDKCLNANANFSNAPNPHGRERRGPWGQPIKILLEWPRTVPHGLASLEDILEMAHGLVNCGNTVQDTAGINTWVTNKCVVKGTLIAGFVRRVSLWQRRETFVSLFHRWPHRALDKSPPSCFNRPKRLQPVAAAPHCRGGFVKDTKSALLVPAFTWRDAYLQWGKCAFLLSCQESHRSISY